MPPYVVDHGQSPRRRHLHLVFGRARSEPQEDPLAGFVRSVRRDMARLLRALHLSGRPVGQLPEAVLTRLSHLDAVTGRFLSRDAHIDRQEVEAAARGMRDLQRWIVNRLSPSERTEVKMAELRTRLSEEDVVGRPLFVFETPMAPLTGTCGPRSLRAGIFGLSPQARRAVAQRLGIPFPPPGNPAGDECERLLQEVASRLLDGHLLGVLVATVSPGAERLLRRVVRHGPLALERSDSRMATVEELIHTALLFCDFEGDRRVAWTPVELHRRLDGVLRSLA